MRAFGRCVYAYLEAANAYVLYFFTIIVINYCKNSKSYKLLKATIFSIVRTHSQKWEIQSGEKYGSVFREKPKGA